MMYWPSSEAPDDVQWPESEWNGTDPLERAERPQDDESQERLEDCE